LGRHDLSQKSNRVSGFCSMPKEHQGRGGSEGGVGDSRRAAVTEEVGRQPGLSDLFEEGYDGETIVKNGGTTEGGEIESVTVLVRRRGRFVGLEA